MEWRILVAEDSPTQRERLRLLLENEGYRVEVAEDGRTGLEKARSLSPELIISDVVMPDMDGYAFCQAVKSSEQTRRVPFVLFTERHTPMDIIEGFLRGADNFIPKSSSDEYLLERVRRILDQLERRRENKLAVEIIVRVGGRDIPISADKQQIFELLISSVEEAGRANERLSEARRLLEQRARDLERHVEERTRELSKAEKKYRALVEQIPAVIYVAAPDQVGRTLYISPQIEALLGFPPAEWETDPDLWPRQLHPDDRERVLSEFARLRRTGKPTSSEYRLLARDGRVVWVRDRAQLIPDGGFVQGVLSDITERKRADDALRASERQLSSIYDNVADVIYYLAVEPDEQFRFLSVNGAFLTATGLSEDQLKGKQVRDVIPEPSCSLVLGKYREAIRDKKTVSWEETTPYPSGLKTGEVSVTPIFDADGRCTHLTGTVHDITERKRAEEEHARLSLVVEQAAESIMITDPQGTITYVNPAFERVSGHARAEAVGQNPRILKSGKHDPAFYRELWATLSRGEAWHGRFINKRKDESLFEEEATLFPVRDSAGKLVNYVAVKRDVTHERGLEEQLRQAQKLDAIGQLAGGIAHDFNNLLGVIAGYGDLLLRELGPAHPGAKRVEQIRRAAERAAGLTRQLLAFSRKQVLESKVLDLNAVVGDVENMLRRLIGEHIQLVTALAPSLGRVKADPGQIEQVIVNLAINARDAMPRGGKLILETANLELDEAYRRTHAEARAGPHVMLAVSDTGHGIDAETLPHIFEPFFTTKAPGKGTGLGLATVYGIVRQSGGHVNVYSEVDRGTSFKVYLPRIEAEQAGEPALAAVPTPTTGSARILLVEDDESLRELVREILEEQGYAVLEGGGPEEILAAARVEPGPIHLVLSDVVLPRMSGRELGAQLRASRPGLRFLYMSGYTDEAIDQHGVLDPGTHFIQKPFTSEALLRKVREVLDEAARGDR